MIKVEQLFLNQVIDFICFGKIILKLFQTEYQLKLAIDLTNWQFGEKNLNFFVAAIVCGNISIPIAWILLNKKENLLTVERKELIEIFLLTENLLAKNGLNI